MCKHIEKTHQDQQLSEEYESGLVSAIIPTYNRADLLSRAIQSVLEQTCQNFEVIVVDDGSMDNTEEIVKGFSDPRIHYLRHEKNKGGSAARNTGIKTSRGEYIAFLDSDDEWFPYKLEKQLRIFYSGDSKLGAVGTGRIINYPDNRSKLIISKNSSGDIYKRLLKRKSFPGNTSTIMIKRECFEQIGLFDESLESFQERDLYIRIAEHYYFDTVCEPLVKINSGAANSISSNTDGRLQGCQMMLLKYSKDMPKVSELRGRLNFEIGIICCRQDKIKEGRNHLLRAVLAYPFSLKHWVNFFFSNFPCYEYLLYKRTWLRRKKTS